MDDVVGKFMELFDGLPDAHGTGAGGWVHRPLIPEDWQAHLAGEGTGIGVNPLRRDGTVRFAAIDLDEPDFEAALWMQDFIPGQSWIERSRSGNAHVWVFFSEPAPAWAVRGILTAATVAAEKPHTEVFPKQDRLRPEMLGNYINLPYHNGSRPILNDISPGQPPYDVETFVDKALHAAGPAQPWVDRAGYMQIVPPEERDQAEFGNSPNLHRCAQYMMEGYKHGRLIGEGARHQAILAMAKQLLNWREADEALAWELLTMFNEENLSPPLPESELRRTFQNVLKGGYTSTGCDDPLLAPFVDPNCPIVQRG